MKNNQETYLQIIRENSLFKDVDNSQLLKLTNDSSFEYWVKRTCILDSKITKKYFFIIISGRIKVYYYNDASDRKLTLFLLTKHDVFDIYNLFQFQTHNVFYETLDDVLVMRTPISAIKEWMLINPIFNTKILHYTIEQMKTLEDYLISTNLDTTTTRLARLLLNNSNNSINNSKLIDGLPHKELAQLIGTTRAVLNRHLQKFKDDGIIDIQNRTIKIINLDLLIGQLNK